MRPIALDLFCCAGGAAMGLNRAGYQVIGVDIEPQPRYPFPFIQADVMQMDFRKFDLIWASPPCQRFCRLRTREDLSDYPDLIAPVRAKLIASGAPYVIENVPDAPVRKDLVLCGAMFGLRSYRHRHFECSLPVEQPEHPKHTVRVNRRGENRREHWANGGFITITGDVGVYCGPEAMGIDWMSGNEMSEAIPPAYAEYIGVSYLTRKLTQPPCHPSNINRLSADSATHIGEYALSTLEEKAQQIKGVAFEPETVRASRGQNGSETNSKSDTPLTQPRSGPVRYELWCSKDDCLCYLPECAEHGCMSL